MTSSDYIKNFNFNTNEIPRPYIIAEAGVNHEGSMDLAKRLVDEAAEGGAHAIKFQSYKASTLASKVSPAYWDTTKEPTLSQFELFSKHDSFWKKEFEQLKVYSDQAGIEFLSTPFDVESAIFLNDLMDTYKISSSDITNLPFIEFMCQFKKPILLSTGASYMWEVQQAVEVIERHQLPHCLMHCVLNYPTLDENANLGMITDLKMKYPNTVIGYSDHTLPHEMRVLETALLLGAVMLEKHFTFDKTLPGNDHYHAMDIHDLKIFNKNLDALSTILGHFHKEPLATEAISRKNARRSLVANADIKEGAIITKEDLTWKRPAFGVSPKDIDEVVGKVATRSISKDDTIYWDMIVSKELNNHKQLS